MKNNQTQKNIPNGWQETKLASIGSFSKGSGITKEQLSETGHNAVRYGELYTKHNFHIKKIYSYISDDVVPFAKKITFGDILFAGSGETAEEIGKSAAYLINEDAYAGGDLIIFRPKNANSLFLSYFLNVGEARKKLSEIGQGQSVVHIYKSDIENLSLHLPPLSEQNRIVSVLEIWDKTLESLAKKIEIKKQIKKGLMQELLTGKTRLPGFAGSTWEVAQLQDICMVSMGQSPSSAAYNEMGKGIPLIQGNNDIKARKTIARIWTTEITKKARKGDIIMTVRAPVGWIGIATEDVCIGRGVCAIRATKVDSDFIFKLLENHESRWKSFEQGTTFTAVNSSDVKGLLLKIPKSKVEQAAIANVLTVEDVEIAYLQRKLSLFQEQKRYLLNNLITGTIRTPESLVIHP
jgi:type I restriction enzyme S subunit